MFVVQVKTIDVAGCRVNQGTFADHGIVRSIAGHFNKIRHRTAKNRLGVARNWTRRPNRRPARRVESVKQGWAPRDGCRVGGCGVHHAPFQALRRNRTLGAPKRNEYVNTLNNPLTRIAFVPVFWFTAGRYTTRTVPWPKIFV
jgi:hypothetical protein